MNKIYNNSEISGGKERKTSKLYGFGNLLSHPPHFVTFEENDWKEGYGLAAGAKKKKKSGGKHKVVNPLKNTELSNNENC